MNSCWSSLGRRRRPASRRPTPSAGRRRPPGPGSGRSARRCEPGRDPSSTSAITSVIRSSVPCSTPFDRLITGASGAMSGPACSSTARNPCDGTAEHDHVGAGARRLEIARSPGAPAAARCRGGSRRSRARRRSARRARRRRAQSVVGALAAASAATVVPHEPAPMTATFTTASLGVRGPQRRRSPGERTHHAVVARLRALRVDLARRVRRSSRSPS